MMKLVAVPLALVVGLIGSFARAASPEIEAELSLGIDGRCVGQHWNAATLTASNPGPSLRGEWEVALHDHPLGAAQGTPVPTFAVPASLPHGPSRLDFALLPQGRSLVAHIRFVVDGRPVFDETQSLVGADHRPLTILITARGPALAPFLLTGREVLMIEPAAAPADPRAYDAVELIVLDEPGLSALPSAARRSIRQWVITGGTLVLTAPFLSASSGSSGLSRLTTARAAGTLPMPGGAPVSAALSAPATPQPVGGTILKLRVPWSDVRAAAGSAPLLFEHALGAGSVRGAAADPDWMQFTDARSQLDFSQSFWARMLQGARYDASTEVAIPWSLVPEGSRMRRLGWPLLALSTLALAVVGPLNWALLVRWRRKEWTVFTAPAAGLLFVGVVGLVAVFVHGSHPLAVYQSVNVASAGRPEVATFASKGLLLPATGRCSFTFPQREAIVHELGADEVTGPAGAAPGTRYRLGDEVSVVGLHVPQWSMRAFASQTAAPDATVEGALALTGDGLAGHVESHLPVPLHDCHLVHRWNHTAVGQALPGERKTLSLPLGPPSLPERQLARVRPLTTLSSCFDAALWGRAIEGRRRDLVREVLGWPFASQLVGPVLIGWGPAIAPAPRVDPPGARQEEQHLYLIRMPVTARGPELVVPTGGALSGSWSGWNSWFAGDRAGERTAAMGAGVAGSVFEYRLPLGVSAARHQELRVHGQIRPPIAGQPPQIACIALYDWAQRKWTSVAGEVRGQFAVPVPDPGRFILMPAGLVRVNIGPAPGEERSGYPIWADISYRGEAVPQ